MPDATPAPTKPFWQSKTVLLNVIALLSLAVPRVAQWLKENPVDVLAALAAINVIVRFATSGRVSIFSGDDDASGGSSSGAVGPFGGIKGGGSGLGTGGQDTNSKQRTPSLPWLVVVACAALLLILPGCTPAQVEAFKGIPITIGVEGQYGTYGYSSKSGLAVTVKSPLPRVTVTKDTPDIEAVLEREWEAGRFAEPVISPHRPCRPRRLVIP